MYNYYFDFDASIRDKYYRIYTTELSKLNGDLATTTTMEAACLLAAYVEELYKKRERLHVFIR